MPISDGWFKPGVSGNPGGRSKTPSARAVLRKALEKPEYDGSTRTRLEAWAEDLATTSDPAERLTILKYLEGNQPPTGFDFGLAELDGPVDLSDAKAALLRGIPYDPNKITIEFVAAPKRPDDDDGGE